MAIRQHIWLYPALYSIGAVFIAAGIIYFDTGHVGVMKELFPSLLLTQTDLAKTILSSIATSLITMTTFTFSSTLVVLTMFSSQFSPRTVENFLSDDKTMKTLGMFLSGFVYAMITLLFMRSSLEDNMVISASVGIVYAIACLVSFIQYINHVGSYIQTENLIYRLYHVAENRIEDYKCFLDQGHIESSQALVDTIEGDFYITSREKGYIQLIDHEVLLEIAKANHLMIESLVKNGDFIDDNTRVFHIQFKAGLNQESLDNLVSQILKVLTVGYRKDDMGDVSFAIHKINEIALRAISPGINDPSTAIHCIKMIGLLLSEIAGIDNGRLRLGDKDGTVIMQMVTFEEELNAQFFEIIHYGRSDISVLSALLEALIMISQKATNTHQITILNFANELVDQMDESINRGSGRDRIQSLLEKLK